MARKQRSPELQKRLIENAGAELKYKERSRQLYNYIYRRSRFFKFTLYFRLAIILFNIFIMHFNHFIITSVDTEYVSDYDVDETHFGNRTDSKDHKSIYLTTTATNTYVIDLLKSEPDKFREEDTIQISKNIFGKKTYVNKLGSSQLNILVELARCNNYLIFVTGFTLFSFMLKDGYDFFSKIFMRAVLAFDLIGIVIYFLT